MRSRFSKCVSREHVNVATAESHNFIFSAVYFRFLMKLWSELRIACLFNNSHESYSLAEIVALVGIARQVSEGALGMRC